MCLSIIPYDVRPSLLVRMATINQVGIQDQIKKNA